MTLIPHCLALLHRCFNHIVSDALLTCRNPRNTTICKALVSQSVRALPQAKGKELQRLLKAYGLKSAREDNKHFKSLQQSGAPPAMEQIPADILGSVLDQLDPFNLAAAACTSKQWQEEAYKEHRWQPFAVAIKGMASSAGQQQPWRKLFFKAATSKVPLASKSFCFMTLQIKAPSLYCTPFPRCN